MTSRRASKWNSMAVLSALVLVGGGVSTSADSGSPTFIDGDFSVGWIDGFILADDPNQPGPGPGTSTADTFFEDSGGNPGSHRRTELNVTFGDLIGTVGINQNAVYDPATLGAISSLTLTIDLLEEPDVGGATGVRIVLEQGGELYYSRFIGFTSAAWTTVQLPPYGQDDFDRNFQFGYSGVDRLGSPDFSPQGAPMTFGYSIFNRIVGPGSLSLTHRADNWQLEVDRDIDSDGVADSIDNCISIANSAQIDADSDGYGNACDADLNNDCIVNVVDLGVLRARFFSTDPVADFNGDGIVNVVDLGMLRSMFFMAPGPSGTATTCG